MCCDNIRATIKPYNAKASLKINIINIPTYNLLAPSTDAARVTALSSTAFSLLAAASPPFDHTLRPLSAFKPKAWTPASPIIPIVPPAAKHDNPQQIPAASYRKQNNEW